MWHAALRNKRILAAAASALTLQISCSHANAAALSASPPPLRSLHEALATGPAGRKYAKASHLGGSLWELVFATQDLRTKVRSAQSQLIDLDRAEGAITPTIAAGLCLLPTNSSATQSWGPCLSHLHSLCFTRVQTGGLRSLALSSMA